MMDRVLRFKQYLSPWVLDDERVFLLGGSDPIMLRGRAHALVAPLIDGRHTVAQILDAIAGRAPAPEVLFSLMTLEKRGYLVAAAHSLSPDLTALWEEQGVDAEHAARQLASTPVTVHFLSGLASQPVADALRGTGVRVTEDGSLHVVVVDDYLDSALENFNRRALEQRLSWTPVKPIGLAVWVGPVFRPNGGPCWACMAQRLRGNRPVEVYLQRHASAGKAGPPTRPAAPTSIQAGAALAALVLSRWIVQSEASPLDQLLTIELLHPATEAHAVVRYPHCPACGDPALLAKRTRSPVVLERRPKRFTADGGHRVNTPEETWARLAGQVSPLTGVVASVGPIAQRDHPLRPVYGSAYRICPNHSEPSFDDFHRVAMGKGRTPAQARASALCEAIERHSLTFRGDELRRRACLDQLDGEGIHPDQIQNFSDTQFQRRDRINARATDNNRRVPLPFDPSVAIEWSPLWSLTRSRRRWAPTAYCYANVPVPHHERFCYMNPNGHAAGNCLEEAILQAFFELVERDAVAIWWYNRLRRPRVDLTGFDEPYFLELEAHYRSMDYSLWVLDVTNDLGIPAFAALSRHRRADKWCMGFGCHLEARLGVQRALTEMNQLFDPAADGPVPLDTREFDDISFLSPDETATARQDSDFPRTQHDDLREDVMECVSRAARIGLETLVLDQTRPDTGLCVVKVIVPGLRHFWQRLGPGRLYDVPVSMGLLERPLEEAELNPVPIKF
ncbi:MAG: TOMM precursor leader peptide-binding protein [Proteobacteria bacterium]|nr:TOMM precursor leader peptide-binding protein [Pseudomonadota bacterium]